MAKERYRLAQGSSPVFREGFFRGGRGSGDKKQVTAGREEEGDGTWSTRYKIYASD